MTRPYRPWIGFTLAALSPLCLASFRPQQGQLDQIVMEQLENLGPLDSPDFWAHASSLRDIARDLDQGELDPLVENWIEKDLGPSELLFLIGVRLQGEDPDVDALLPRLLPLLDSENAEEASAAIGLLANPAFKALSDENHETLGEALQRLVENGDRAPRLRLDAAVTLHAVGGSEMQRLAHRQMRAFLESSEAELRALGAIALARTGAEITGDLMDELERLSALPGARGELAESYLKQERLREHWNRKVKRIQEYYGENPSETPSQASDFSPEAQFRQVLTMVEQMHIDGDKVEREYLLDAALDGMLSSLDPHSAYFSPKEYERFEQELEAHYGGIGAYVNIDRLDNLFTITRPIYSGPAYRAGLLSDDKIVRIDDWSTLGQPQDDIIKRLKGRPGTSVRLYVWRRGMDLSLIDRPTEEMAVDVTRESITIPPLTFEMLPGDIGLIELRDFSRAATSELQTTVSNLLAGKPGMRAIILDVRNNPGGLLDEAASVASLFIEKGKLVVTTESTFDARQEVFTKSDPIVPKEMPVVVLINRFSASASEIVSGVLQDYGRGAIVGERSFGKGSVQNLIPVQGTRDDTWQDENGNKRFDNWEKLGKDWNKNGSFDFAPRVKLTVAMYRLPSGRSIHRELDSDLNVIHAGGVVPDVNQPRRDIATWRQEEMYRIRIDEQRVRAYLDQHFDANRELFEELAVNDMRETSRYPDFEAFFASLNTPLPADDVRFLIRDEARRRVEDRRGREFAVGDFVEDLQVQASVRICLEKLGETPDQYDAYAATFRDRKPATITVADAQRDDVKEALKVLAQARAENGRISSHAIDRLVELLEGSLASSESKN